MAIVAVVEGPQGPPGLNWKGAYDPTATYAAYDGVAYQGSSYIALQAVQGVTPGTAPLQWELFAAAGTVALNESLLQWAYANSFQLVSATRDANSAIISAAIVWPDGATGTFTTDVASTAFPGAIDAWHATYVSGAVALTVTQPQVTRDTNGAVTAQPAITIA